MPPRAVLFDFDGVLADTENVHVAAWERTFGAMGWNVDAETCARAAEVDDRAFLTEIFAARGIQDGDVAGWVERKQAITLPLLAGSPRLYPGVVELVRWLADRARLAIVSTTWRENITVVLQGAALSDCFMTIVGKEDVAQVKPDPAGYKLALKRLSVAASKSLAVEDSEGGLHAAQRAGVSCLVVGHRGPLPRKDWVGSTPYLADFSDLPAALSALGFDSDPP